MSKIGGYLFLIIVIFFSCKSYENTTKGILKDADLHSVKKYGNYIWTKNKDSVVVVNKKNLEEIYKKSNRSSSLYFRSLDYYSSQLPSAKINKELTFPERTYISAYIIEYLYKCQDKFRKDDVNKNRKFIYRLLSPSHIASYNKELKKQNYYGLKFLKENHLKYHIDATNIDTLSFRQPDRIID
ncbi:hypothetical protein OAT18_01030 [Tenacibaculum sp.]|nr:hypothetical protein [Tenacibaculum sp.]